MLSMRPKSSLLFGGGIAVEVSVGDVLLRMGSLGLKLWALQIACTIAVVAAACTGLRLLSERLTSLVQWLVSTSQVIQWFCNAGIVLNKPPVVTGKSQK